jgi:hypothetical protein
VLATNLGFYNTSSSRTHVRFQFSTHAAAGGNVAPQSAFEAADLRIYKATDGAAFSATQRSSANGITMTSPFDTLTGVHDVDIDLTDNTDAGFYAAGSFYSVVLSPDETIDSQTITGVVLAYFEIGVLPVNVTQNAGTAITSASGIQEVKVASIAANAITATAINADAITAAKIADGAIDAATFAASAITATVIAADAITAAKIADGAIDAATFAAGAINAAAIAADAITDAKVAADVTIASVTGAVGSVTGAVGSVTGNVGGNVVGSVGSVTGLTAATVHSDLDDIQARLPAALTSDGNMKSDALRVNGSALAAARMQRAGASMVLGTCAALGTTTSVIASALAPTSAVNDQFNGRIIIFADDTTTTALRGQATDITDYVHATLTFTVTALTTAPQSGDTFVVV